jgi:hypothetical protein
MEAARVCEEVEKKLERLIRNNKNTREDIPEGTALVALQQITEELCNLSHYTSNKSEELIKNN